MWFCLSSGARSRYLDDIIRSLALPAGAELVFRYDKKHLSADALNFVRSTSVTSHELVIAYVDRASQAYPPFIIPCRRAQIEEVSDHGPIITINLKLGEFAYASDIEDFQSQLKVLVRQTTG